MNYNKFKKKVLDLQYTDSKGLHKFLIQLSLLLIIVGVGLAFIAGSLISTILSCVILLFMGVGFFFVLDYVACEQVIFDKVYRIVRYWWVSIPIFGLVIMLLYLGNFIKFS